MPPGGRRPVSVDDGRLAVLAETVRNGDCSIAPGVDVLTLGNGIDKCWAAIIRGLPVGIAAGLLNGLFQRLVEGIGFDRYSVAVSGMRSRNRRYSGSLRRLPGAGTGCGFRAYGSDIDAHLAAAHHDGDRAVARA